MKKDKNPEQEIHRRQEMLTEQIYSTPGMLPSKYVYILTNQCNLRCDFCYMDKEPREGNLTAEDWMHLTDQLPEYARVTLTGGEPFIFPEFRQVFSYVAERRDCNVISNGLLLTRDLTDFMLSFPRFKVISISVDSLGNTIRGVSPARWKKAEEQIRYFASKKKISGAILDLKTVVLDETADQIFDIYKYCVEELGCDYHVFQFLKGSPIQHSDVMFSFEDIFKPSRAKVYERFDTIKEQLRAVQDYNMRNGRVSFLHPNFGSLVEDDDLSKLDLLNVAPHLREKFIACKYAWSSVHINYDGNLFSCLAIPLGNVKNKSLADIVQGEESTRFRKAIRENRTVEACNRCGFLKPAN